MELPEAGLSCPQKSPLVNMACWGKGFPRKRLWSVNKHIVHVDELLMEDKHHLGVLRRWFFQTHLESDSVSHAVMSDSLWSPWTIAPGSFVHGILQARILEWLAFFFSKGSFWPRDRTWVSCIAGRFFTIWATRVVQLIWGTNHPPPLL